MCLTLKPSYLHDFTYICGTNAGQILIMITTKLTFKKRSSSRSNQHPIYIEVSFNRQERLFVSTNIKIEEKYWNTQKRSISKSIGKDEYQNIHNRLNVIKNKIDGIITKFEANNQSLDPDQLKIELDKSDKSIAVRSFFDHLEEFVEFKKGKVKTSSITDYNALKRHLIQFQKHRNAKLRIENLNSDKFYYSFHDFLTYHTLTAQKTKGLSKNSVGKQIKNLKVFINHLIQFELIPFRNLKNWKAEQVDVDSIALNEEELDAMYQLDLSKDAQLEKIRDVFILGCETGLRFSDFSSIKKENINGNHIALFISKTSKRKIVPISPRVKELLIKYDNQLPTFNTSTAFNEKIKEIAKKAEISNVLVHYHQKGKDVIEDIRPKHDFVSSHTCRRSFCTNMFKKGMPVMLIRKLSGHTTDKSFYKYIKINEEEAAEMMLEWWEKNTK